MEKSKGRIILWIFIAIFCLVGISALFSGSFVFALAFLLMAAILFPKTEKFLSDKYHFNLTKKIKVISIVVLLIIVGIASPKSQSTEQVAEKVNNTSNSTNQTANLETEAQTTAVQPVVEQQKPVSTIDQLWTILDRTIKTRDGYDISYAAGSKTATIIRTSTDLWDESSLVRESYKILVKYGLEAFKRDDINNLTVDYKTEFTDTYGKKSMQEAVILTISKVEFSKYDWNNLNYQPIYRQMESSCSTYYIHPAILKNLNYNKLYLSL